MSSEGKEQRIIKATAALFQSHCVWFQNLTRPERKRKKICLDK